MPFGEYENFEDCVSKNSDKDNPEAYCAEIKRKIEGDRQKKVGFDKALLEDKVLVDDDNVLTMPAVVASEIVQRYDDGFAWKPADEIEKMAHVARDIGAVPVKILEHPTAETNYLLLKHGDVHGRVSNFEFVKNLKDSKTNRPNRRGLRGDISWFKNRVPEKVLNEIRDGGKRDVSIGFTFDKDVTSGTWNGQSYDYIQRNIFLNHVAAPLEKGRCPSPVCGIGFDASLKFGMDEAALNKCPVCRRIADVGLETAGKRLYLRYGRDVLNVIAGRKPKPVKPAVDSLSREFRQAMTLLESSLEKEQLQR